MAYQNKHDTSGINSRDGANAEEIFRNLAEKQGYEVVDATRNEQFAHIDFWLKKDGGKWGFEVKARKKLSRQSEEYDDSKFWCEWVGVSGKAGWLRTGSDFLAIEQENEFLIVDRKKLEKLAESLVDFTKVVDRAHKALNVTFRRFRRKDLLSIIETAKVREITHKIWPKKIPKNDEPIKPSTTP